MHCARARTDELVAIEGRPWAEYGKEGKPLSQNQLARLLRPVGVIPDVLRLEGKSVRAYQLHLFADAFARYLAPEGDYNRNSVAEPVKPGTSCMSQLVAADPALRVGTCKKPNNDGLGYTVTVVKGEKGGNDEGLVCEHCGSPATADQPVRECMVEGDRHLLHLHCEREWLHPECKDRLP